MTTPTIERCTLTDLLVTDCAHCRRIPDPPPRKLGRLVTAQYRGRCADCGMPYSEGDQIRCSANGWVAECCWEV